MNILVTGGAGYIGSHTCVELIAAGYTPIIVDNLCNSGEESLRRVEKITGKHVEYICGDVRDEVLLDRVFSRYDIACCIHFAGLKAVGESVEKPLEYYENNLGSTMTLCKAMAAHGVKKMFFPLRQLSIPAIMRCLCGRHPKPAIAPIPTDGPSTWASRSCGILPRPIRVVARRSWAGERSWIKTICAATHGTGRAKTQMATMPNKGIISKLRQESIWMLSCFAVIWAMLLCSPTKKQVGHI